MNLSTWIGGTVVSVAVVCAPAFGQVADDARALLMESREAVNKVEAMTYSVKKSGTGMLKDIVDLTGDVKLWREAGAATPRVLIRGRWKEPGKKDGTLLLTRDASTVTWLDYSDNTRANAQLNDSKAQEAMSQAKNFMVTDMVNTDYDNILRMTKVEKAGAEKVGDELCDVIVGTSVDGSRVFTYAISVADRLPRRFEMATGQGEGKIAMVTEVFNYKPATFTAKDFEIEKPSGFMDKNLGGPTPALPANQPAITLGPKVGEAAPEFSLTDSTGGQHSPASFKGKVAVLQFFGSMFKASATGAAEMQLLSDEMKGKNVAFVGLACRELSDTAGAEFFKNNKLSYTLVPKGDDAASALNIKGYPSYVILDTEGRVSAFFQDNPGKDKLTEAIKAAGAK